MKSKLVATYRGSKGGSNAAYSFPMLPMGNNPFTGGVAPLARTKSAIASPGTVLAAKLKSPSAPTLAALLTGGNPGARGVANSVHAAKTGKRGKK